MENKNNKNIYLATVGLLVVIAFVFLSGAFKYDSSPIASSTPKAESPTKPDINQVKPEFPGQTLPLSNAPKDLAWDFFQKYLAYNKNHNLEGVKSVVYKVAPVCDDPKTLIDCEARMGSAYSYGSALIKEDFVNVWEDGKQIILATDYKIQQDETAIGRNRAIIYFIKDEAGNLKLLSFSPRKGAFTSKGTASEEELNARIILYTEDKDEDGLEDYIEECIPTEIKDTCVPTDPKLRDTDGDGLWDGIEALMQ